MNEAQKIELLQRLDKARNLEKRIAEVRQVEERLTHLVESGHAIDIKIKLAVSDDTTWVDLRATSSDLNGLSPSDLRDSLVKMYDAVVIKRHKLEKEYEGL